jgi:hypothetical protein
MKKFFVYIILLILIVIFLLYILGMQQKNEGSMVFEQKTTNSSLFVEIDTDNDGLKDWEESLWNTNPKVYDTDGDGTSDGEEIDIGRNPLLIPPDNNLPDLLAERESADNKTNTVAEEIITNYLVLKNSGEFNDEKTQKELIDALAKNISFDESDFVPYAISDLNITDSKSTTTLMSYQGNILGFVDKYVYSELGNELQILLDVIGVNANNKEKQNAYIELEKAERTYNAISEDLLIVLVPSSLASKHLKSVNTFKSLSHAVNKMKNTINDPILSVLAVQYYLEVSDTLTNI